MSRKNDGIIATFNQGAERLFGYKAEEVVGKPVTILIPADRQDEEPEILARFGAARGFITMKPCAAARTERWSIFG
jgi:PAS domain S-box-containing protein